MRNDRLLRACKKEQVDRVPIWLMRQIGRYLPEYRELKKRKDFMEICRDPELVAELTVVPVERFGVDGAIVFSDILVPLFECGFKVKVNETRGEVEVERLRSRLELKKLYDFSEDYTYFVYEGIRRARKLLNDEVPVIGFAGAPFTLACYLIEGKVSRNVVEVKKLMYGDGQFWDELMRALSYCVALHVKAQVAAGSLIIQLFDSWVGALSPSDYQRFVLPYTKELVTEIKKSGCYVIYFATCSAGLLENIKELGSDVVGIDWRIEIGSAWKIIGFDKGIQGNLDPAVLLAEKARISEESKKVLDGASARRGYIFNLGHGILPDTPPENVKHLVEYVHEYEVRP